MLLFIYYFLYSFHISILCTYFLRSCYIISDSALETSAEIQSTLGKNITSLQYLKPGGNFSIKKWFSNSNETE
nr:type IV secretion system DNA-binding domain-containing protein [Orientia tsutsugamushi]